MAIFNLTANSAFYAEIWDLAAGNRWNGTAMVAPGTIASSDWATGMTALSELLTSDSGNTGVYAFAAPAGLPKGSYLVAVHSVNTFEPIVNAAALMEFTYDGAAEDASAKAVVGAAISDAALPTAILDLAGAIDGKTLRQSLRYLAALLAGKVSGAGTGTETFMGLEGATNRVQVTVDATGNRSNVVYDPAS
jgi:hypothetical protein